VEVVRKSMIQSILYRFILIGKSSCVQLLTRLYEVNGGNILLDGVPLTDYDREWLRLHTALVSQETVRIEEF
jgi:ABC-type multidrug transport system fused ATPase/permease subunit